MIDNDGELDRWWENFIREQSRRAGKRGSSDYSLLPFDPGGGVPAYGGEG